jgi:hypothetical protein
MVDPNTQLVSSVSHISEVDCVDLPLPCVPA